MSGGEFLMQLHEVFFQIRGNFKHAGAVRLAFDIEQDGLASLRGDAGIGRCRPPRLTVATVLWILTG